MDLQVTDLALMGISVTIGAIVGYLFYHKMIDSDLEEVKGVAFKVDEELTITNNSLNLMLEFINNYPKEIAIGIILSTVCLGLAFYVGFTTATALSAASTANIKVQTTLLLQKQDFIQAKAIDALTLLERLVNNSQNMSHVEARMLGVRLTQDLLDLSVIASPLIV